MNELALEIMRISRQLDDKSRIAQAEVAGTDDSRWDTLYSFYRLGVSDAIERVLAHILESQCDELREEEK